MARQPADTEGSRDERPLLDERRKTARQTASFQYAARRQELVAAAGRVFFDKGFNATSINDIAKAAGVDRTSVYYYAGSKIELFEQTVGNVMTANTVRAEEIARSDAPASQKLEMTIVELMQSYERDYPILYAYVREDLSKLEVSEKWIKKMQTARRRYDNALMKIIRSGVEEGIFRADLPVREVTYGVIGMTSWSYRWFKPGGSMSGAATGRVLAESVIGGLLKRDEPPTES